VLANVDIRLLRGWKRDAGAPEQVLIATTISRGGNNFFARKVIARARLTSDKSVPNLGGGLPDGKSNGKDRKRQRLISRQKTRGHTVCTPKVCRRVAEYRRSRLRKRRAILRLIGSGTALFSHQLKKEKSTVDAEQPALFTSPYQHALGRDEGCSAFTRASSVEMLKRSTAPYKWIGAICKTVVRVC